MPKERVVEASYVELEPNEYRQKRRVSGCLCAVTVTAVIIAIGCSVGLLVFVLGGSIHHKHDHHHREGKNKPHHEKEWISFSRPEEYGDSVPREEAEIDVDEQKIVHINTVYGAQSTTLYLYHKKLIVSRDMGEEECLILPLQTTFEEDVAKLKTYQKTRVAPKMYVGDLTYGEEIGEKELTDLGEEILSLCQDVPTFHAWVKDQHTPDVKDTDTEELPEVEETLEDEKETDKAPRIENVDENSVETKPVVEEMTEEAVEKEEDEFIKNVMKHGWATKSGELGDWETAEWEGSGDSDEWLDSSEDAAGSDVADLASYYGYLYRVKPLKNGKGKKQERRTIV